MKTRFYETLAEIYPREEVASFFNILSGEYLRMSRLDISLNPQKKISETEIQKFENALERLKQHEPVQYITGSTEFFGLPFRVTEDVLIPRPETEELVEWILEDLRKQGKKEAKILDIGTGSGCIAISLAKNLPQAKVWAIDISEQALKIAGENASKNEVRVDFKNLDILKTGVLSEKYDVIVSNPPYVREMEKRDMRKNVLNFEPDTALYVKDRDPLIFYAKITALAAHALEASGALYFEINQYLGKETEELMQKKDFLTCLKKDIFGVDRMIKGLQHEN